MALLPDESLALLDCFAPVCTRPTDQRFLVPLGAAIITTGRRTVAHRLRAAGSLASGHVSSDRRVFSNTPIVWAGDDTVSPTPGLTLVARRAIGTRSARRTPSPPGGPGCP